MSDPAAINALLIVCPSLIGPDVRLPPGWKILVLGVIKRVQQLWVQAELRADRVTTPTLSNVPEAPNLGVSAGHSLVVTEVNEPVRGGGWLSLLEVAETVFVEREQRQLPQLDPSLRPAVRNRVTVRVGPDRARHGLR